MKKILFKISVFIILFFIVDFILGEILEPLYFKVKSGTIFNTVYGIRDTHDEILIFGASEVKHSFISKQIEDSLGLTCYNLGFDGNNIYYQYAMLSEILDRYTPHIVVVSTSITAEDESSIISLFPFHKRYRRIRETIFEIAPVEKFKTISNAYVYNSLILNIIQGLIYPEPETNGYRPLYNEKYNIESETRKYSIPSSPRTLDYFDKFLKLAVSSGCKVVVVGTPKCWYNSSNGQPSNIKELISHNHVLYLDYENDTTFLYNNDIYYDGVHLNHKGAEVFTRRFISDLKNNVNFFLE